METNTYSSFSQLLNELSVPLAQRKTGTFFIATDNNSSCRFAIMKGKITHCCYKRFHGPDALQALQAGLKGRSAFSENKPSLFRSSDLVSHMTAIALLGIRLPAPRDKALPKVEEINKVEQPKYLKKTYRGQEILTERPKPASNKARKKPPRIYRGQVLKD